MRIITLILLTILFSETNVSPKDDSTKINFKFKGFTKKLDLEIIPTNNAENILAKKYLEQHDIDALKIIAKNYQAEPVDDNDVVIFETSRGIMKLKLFHKIAPNHCNNFKKLANSGFYDETFFHRIIRGFMIQAGDVNTRDNNIYNDGQGNPGWQVDAEFNDIKHKKGILSMARGGDINSAGSQFFICSGNAPWLDGEYTAFGEVIDNLYAIDLLENTETERTSTLRSCFEKIPKEEDPGNWVKVKDRRDNKILYSKIPESYTSESYTSYLYNQLNNDRPISSPEVIKIRVVGQND